MTDDKKNLKGLGGFLSASKPRFLNRDPPPNDPHSKCEDIFVEEGESRRVLAEKSERCSRCGGAFSFSETAYCPDTDGQQLCVATPLEPAARGGIEERRDMGLDRIIAQVLSCHHIDIRINGETRDFTSQAKSLVAALREAEREVESARQNVRLDTKTIRRLERDLRVKQGRDAATERARVFDRAMCGECRKRATEALRAAKGSE